MSADTKTTYTSGTIGPIEAVANFLATIYRQRWRRCTSHGARALLSPLLMVVLTLIFSPLVGIRFRDVLGNSGLNFGLYLYCGLIPFLAFSDALTKSTNSIRSNSALV